MKTFKFGTLPKSTIDVHEDGTLFMQSILFGKAEFNADEVEVIYIKPPTFTETGHVYISLDGKQSSNIVGQPTTFYHIKKQRGDLNSFISLLQEHNQDIETKESGVTVMAQAKEAKLIKKQTVSRHAIRCPKCKSTNVTFMDNKRKGFSVGKAVAGGVLTGGIGTIAGFAGKKGKDRWHCADCGNVFQKK